MAWSLPRLLRRLRPDARALPARAAARLERPERRHAARPALRARPERDGPRSTGSRSRRSCRALGATARRTCSPSPSGRSATRSSSTASTPEKITVTPHGVDPGVHAGRRHASASTCSSSARCRRARTRSPRSPRRGPSACRSSSPGPRRSRSSRASCATAAPTCAAGSTQAELAELYRGAAALVLPVALRGLRDPGARGDGERHAGRALGRRRRCARSPATQASYAEDGDLAGAVARVLADRDALRAARGSSARAASRGRRRRALTADVYRKVLA